MKGKLIQWSLIGIFGLLLSYYLLVEFVNPEPTYSDGQQPEHYNPFVPYFGTFDDL